MSDNTNPLIDALRDLPRYSPDWYRARDRLHDHDPDAYREWLEDEWETDQRLRELKGDRRIPDDPAEFADYMAWWKSTHPADDEA